MGEHGVEPRGEALGRDALPRRSEVGVVVAVADGKPVDDAFREFFRIAPPLLGGVVADHPFVESAADERDGLFLEVPRLGDSFFPDFFREERAGLVRRELRSVEIVDRLQVDRHRVDAAGRAQEDAVAVAVEIREAPDVVPDRFVRRVEDVRAVDVDLDAGFRIDLGARIAPDFFARFEHHDLPVEERRDAFRENTTRDARADHVDGGVRAGAQKRDEFVGFHGADSSKNENPGQPARGADAPSLVWKSFTVRQTKRQTGAENTNVEWPLQLCR